MFVRLFDSPNSPFTLKRRNPSLTNSASPIPQQRNKILLQDNFILEFLYRVDERVKNEILKQIPFLQYQDKIVFDNHNVEKPFKIVLGKGRHSEARLAKISKLDNPDFCIFVVIRKIKSEIELNADSAKEIHSKSANSVSRDDIINFTQKEFDLFDVLIKLGETKNFSIVWLAINKLNKENKNQLYQCFPLADIGDGKRFINVLRRVDLSKAERLQLFEYLAKTLLIRVSAVNRKMFFLRDIKTDNILVSSNGDIAVSDLGSAKYYGEDGVIEASDKVDGHYRAPFSVFAHLSKEERDVIQDSWSLALTLLQFYSYPLEDFINDEFFLYATKIKMNPEPVESIKNHYINTLTDLKAMSTFQELPIDLRMVLLGMLELDKSKRLPLHELIEKYNVTFDLNVIPNSIQIIFNKIKNTAFFEKIETLNQPATNLGYVGEDSAEDFTYDDDAIEDTNPKDLSSSTFSR